MAEKLYPDNAFERRSGDSAASSKSQDERSAFAKDRDRLIYSSAFRRLAGKSQVVASTEIGPFHTRLTHSLKVAQLGRRLAERLRDEPERHRPSRDEVYAPDPDLVEFACLAHDIGHPPFGHAGEQELHMAVDELLRDALGSSEAEDEESDEYCLNLGGFEGNPQSFRIVTRLAHKWLNSDGGESLELPKDWYGLDLTAASMDAVSKYPWGRHEIGQRKWGAYGREDDESSDYAALKWARGMFGRDLGIEEKKSFECQIMNWCDDVTYAVHDVEDFFQIGMIPLHLIFYPLGEDPETSKDYPDQEWEVFREYVRKKWDGTQRERSNDELDNVRESLLSAADGLVVWGYSRDSVLNRRYSHYRANQLIEHFVKDVSSDGDPMLHDGNLRLGDDSQLLKDQCNLLKELIWKYVIESPRLSTQQAGQRRIIRDLVTIYSSDISLLPLPYVDFIEGQGSGYSGSNSRTYAEIRAAADYVASLTETHAVALHRRFSGIELGGFRDLV